MRIGILGAGSVGSTLARALGQQRAFRGAGDA